MFPFAGAALHFDAASVAVPSPLARRARQGLRAAELLFSQGCPGPALDLLIPAMLAVVADRAGQERAPSRRDAGLWL